MKPEKLIPVVQHNKLIEARYSLTVGEQRLIMVMASKIKPTDEDFREYKISLSELARLLEIDLSYIYKEIDKITDKLMSRVLHIKNNDGSLLKLQWICKAIHTNNSVTLSFIPDLKPYLLKLQREFTITDLNIVKNFQSIYSVRIYQLLKQYAGTGWRELTVQELREILGVGKKYPVFQDFKRRVIMQAASEFEDPENKCDLRFKCETIREGRKITKLKFLIFPHKVDEPKPEEKQPAPPPQPAIVHPTHKYFSRLPFDRYDDEFGQWLAEKRLIVDLQQWGESGYNSFMCRDSYNKFLKETGRE
jgi:plasmid replication initiation protein